MTQSTELAASAFAFPRDVAGRVAAELRNRLQDQTKHSSTDLPSDEQLARLLDVVFLASIMREEGSVVRVCLRYMAPEGGTDQIALRLQDHLPLSPETLRKISPAAGPRVELGVFNVDDELRVWGFIYPSSRVHRRGQALTIRAPQPGVLVGSILHKDLFVYSHGEIWIFEPALPPISMWMARRRGRPEGFLERARTALQLMSLAAESLEQGFGATVLIVPEGETPRGVLAPRYAATEESMDVLAGALMGRDPSAVLQGIAHLAKIDGALVVDAKGRIWGAGVMVAPSETSDFDMVLLNPGDSTSARDIKFSEFLGGARHQAAFRFCQLNIGAWALVASHDGIMSVVTRAHEDDVVSVFRPFYAGMRL